ncbi:hypothetical protein NARC_50025 [Candidatus Nitrosocosmicus arcticus]|uniref:Uncharacterized protein n=1 Tax=Candidatus Nitrosocosmicus arcticus TaxID=2035267 RepID=A0A557SW61_9ARCH|nr:hypothetical protein NARC_50025 [Candidatus Nitrosocosmicus arcticus]
MSVYNAVTPETKIVPNILIQLIYSINIDKIHLRFYPQTRTTAVFN